MKVGDLQAALRDAKHMIDLEKVGVTVCRVSGPIRRREKLTQLRDTSGLVKYCSS